MAVVLNVGVVQNLLDNFFLGTALYANAAARYRGPDLVFTSAPYELNSDVPGQKNNPRNISSFTWNTALGFSVGGGAQAGTIVPITDLLFGLPITTAFAYASAPFAAAAGDDVTIDALALVYEQQFNSMNRLFGDEWGEWLFGIAGSITVPTIYLGVATSTSIQDFIDGTYTELGTVVTSGYARQAAGAIWDAAADDGTGAFTDNNTGVTFGPVGTYSGGGGAIWYVCAFDASSGGNIIGVLSTAFGVTTGWSNTFAAGDLKARVQYDSGGAIGVQTWFSFPSWPTITEGAGVTISTPAGFDWLDHVRGIGGRLLIGVVVNGVLTVRRHNDAVPDAFSASTSIETSGVTSCSIGHRRCGIVDLFYCHSGAVKYRTSRNQGVTFSVSTTIASGYDCVAHWLDEDSGICIAMVWNAGFASWYVSVGTLGDDGVTWTFTTPSLVVAGKKAGASVQRRADGVVEFAYITAAGVATMIRCKALQKTGSGSWA